MKETQDLQSLEGKCISTKGVHVFKKEHKTLLILNSVCVCLVQINHVKAIEWSVQSSTTHSLSHSIRR